MARPIIPICLVTIITLFGTCISQTLREGGGGNEDEPNTSDGLIAGFADDLKKIFNAAVSDLEGVLDTATGGRDKNGLGKILNTVGQGAGALFKKAASGINNAVDAVTSGWGNAINQTKLALRSGNVPYRAGRVVNALGMTVANLAGAGVDFGISQPLLGMGEGGGENEEEPNTSDGLIAGFADDLKNTFNGAVSDLEGVVDNATGGDDKNVLGKIVNTVGQGAGALFKNAASGINNAVDAETSGWGNAIDQARHGLNSGNIPYRAGRVVNALGMKVANLAGAGVDAVKGFASDLGDTVNGQEND